jgi:Ran GTPase-activating protein (RanGAP) involved in mRNA processing and transport
MLIKQLSEQRLTRLHLAPNSVRAAQTIALSNAIASSPSLTSVCLGQNHMDDGVASILASWLAEYNGLRVLR